jgi:hypothetical protein
MTIRINTPNGWRPNKVTPSEYEYNVTTNARDMVRETAYNVVRMVAEGHKQDSEWSRAVNLYRMACNHLRAVDVFADCFINSTYTPQL